MISKLVRVLFFILLVFFLLNIYNNTKYADIEEQAWCKESYEILFRLYDGQLKDQLTQEEIDLIGFILNTYFESYEILIGEEWNSGVVIWQIFMVNGPDDISRSLASEAIKMYNQTYDRSYELGSNKLESDIADTFLMQKYILEYMSKTKSLELCKVWYDLSN